MNQYLLKLADIREEDISLVGNKSWNLAQLEQQGYPVPRAFCLTQRAWEVFLERAGLEEAFQSFCQAFHKGESEQILFAQAQKLSKKIESYSLPLEIEEAIRFAWDGLQKPLAIRSSGLDEDLSQASFAGMHQSFLNLTDLKQALQKVKECWQSIFTPCSLFYRLQKRDQPIHTFGMAVILQEMIEPHSFGVLFTINPVLGKKEVMIEVSQGEENQENFIFSRNECVLLERRTLGSGPVHFPIKQLQKLCRLALEVENFFGSPQDVEWVYNKEKLYLLQSRPITSLPSEDETTYWTGANSQEVLWKPVTPLTFSFFAPMVERGRKELFETLKIEEHFRGEEYLRLFYGRPYFNVNYFNKFVQKLGIASRDLFETLIFGEKIQMESPLPAIPFNRRILKLACLALRTCIRGPGQLKKFYRWFKPHCREPRYTTIPPRGQKKELLRFIKKNAALMESALRMHVLGTAFAGGYFFATGKFLRFLHQEEGIWTGLASGIPGIQSAQEGRCLFQLAQIARELPGVEYVLRRQNGEKDGHEIDTKKMTETLLKVEGGPEFLCKLDDFIGEFGHRSLMEADLSVPRRRENPAFLFHTLRKYLEGHSLKDCELDNRRRRIYLSRKILREVSTTWLDKIFPWKRILLGHLLKSLVEFMPYRENLKDLALRPLYYIRQAFLRLEETFLDEGLLEEQGDIFFLNYREVLLLAREHSLDSLKKKIDQAKKKHCQDNEQLIPRMIVMGGKGEERHAQKDGGTTMVGLGCSPGIASGRARVIGDNRQIHSLRGGEILVIRTADPAMTPLFLLTKGVVMDVGGALSHSVVIAREYAIPCVAGLGDATERIQTGNWITVDGSRGLVYLHDK